MKEIELTQGYVTIVDDDWYEELSKFKWWAWDSHPRHTYACRWSRGVRPRFIIRMHHVVLRIEVEYLRENNLVVDHIDRDGLNNQNDNLRIVTKSVNAYNSDHSDQALGIYWDTVRDKYKAFILKPTKRFIGWFDSVEEATAFRNSIHENN